MPNPNDPDYIPIVYGTPETDRLRVVNDRGTFIPEAQKPSTASLSGPMPVFGKRLQGQSQRSVQPVQSTEIHQAARPNIPPRKLTPEEMKIMADQWLANIKAQTAQAEAAGPSVRHLEHGGPDNGYTTQLNPAAEKAFQNLKAKNRPFDSGADYDLRGAYAAGSDLKALTDEYKRPNHPTFSNESRYAPEKAGRWNDIPPQPKAPPRVIQEQEKAVPGPTSRKTGVEANLPIMGKVNDAGYDAGSKIGNSLKGYVPQSVKSVGSSGIHKYADFIRAMQADHAKQPETGADKAVGAYRTAGTKLETKLQDKYPRYKLYMIDRAIDKLKGGK